MFEPATPEEMERLIREGAPNVKVSEDTKFLEDIERLVHMVRELGHLVEKAIEQEEEYEGHSFEEAEGLGRLHEQLNELENDLYRRAKLIERTLKLFGR